MRSLGIVTTASLPWLTGTSIMPLFHAVHLKRCGYKTTLYVPWLPPEKQHHCFADHRFNSEDEQRQYIAQWLSEELRPFCPEIRFYPSVYVKPIESIGPLKNPDRFIDDHDLVILEEPEHLFAPYPWNRIRKDRKHVIGIVMTNYEYYHGQHIPKVLARWYQHYSRFIMQHVCHRLLAIAPVQQDVCSLPICQVVPLNGVDAKFFEFQKPLRDGGCYFMGKLIPEKGIEELFSNLSAAGVSQIDLYGNGSNQWIDQLSLKYKVNPSLKGLSYQPWQDIAGYNVFINCSRSEYLCTTTANALVMGHWVIVPEHPSNQFYASFRNCLTYSSQAEFIEQYKHTQTHAPAEDPKKNELSWEAACNRLIDVIEKEMATSRG